MNIKSINMKAYRTMNQLLMTILFFVGLTISCDDKDDPFVLRNTDVLDFGYESSIQTFTVCTNGSWTVNSEQNWINLSPSSGVGDGETREIVSVLVDRNPSTSRSGQIFIHAGGKEIFIDVKQEDGSIKFGTPSLSGTILADEDIQDINLRIPYERAVGTEQFSVSVAFDGVGASGINPIENYPVSLTSETGMVYIPLTGHPSVEGGVVITVTVSLSGVVIEPFEFLVGTDKMEHGADFIISGYLSDPDGTDSPEPGVVSGGGFTHTGGYEYIQLLALKDIDFTQTSYCLVTCINATATSPGAKGWVAGKEGNKLTYQINIDQGSVKKGEFFYVGGSSRLLDSYPSSGAEASPTVSSYKWPIAINYFATAGGDGNGIAVGGSGILGNTANVTPPTNVGADGIAVFRGTSIDENTIPMDAIFFGDKLDKYVFQIPNNDHYRRIALSGTNQPYFGQGTNIWTAPTVPVHDEGYFTALGGELTTTEWIIPRSGSFIQMKKSAGIIHTTDEIETPSSCTKFIDN